MQASGRSMLFYEFLCGYDVQYTYFYISARPLLVGHRSLGLLRDDGDGLLEKRQNC